MRYSIENIFTFCLMIYLPCDNENVIIYFTSKKEIQKNDLRFSPHTGTYWSYYDVGAAKTARQKLLRNATWAVIQALLRHLTVPLQRTEDRFDKKLIL